MKIYYTIARYPSFFLEKDGEYYDATTGERESPLLLEDIPLEIDVDEGGSEILAIVMDGLTDSNFMFYQYDTSGKLIELMGRSTGSAFHRVDIIIPFESKIDPRIRKLQAFIQGKHQYQPNMNDNAFNAIFEYGNSLD